MVFYYDNDNAWLFNSIEENLFCFFNNYNKICKLKNLCIIEYSINESINSWSNKDFKIFIETKLPKDIKELYSTKEVSSKGVEKTIVDNGNCNDLKKDLINLQNQLIKIITSMVIDRKKKLKIKEN